MKKKDISRLLQRYLTGHQEGKDAYFDADEFFYMSDYFVIRILHDVTFETQHVEILIVGFSY